ncbi:MAG TPA: CUAEP/CCAEP-tail radical SAM protein [Vicinamibacterales bacterium]|nr:CUAEP/CCAEP-tail radical SAM protein [Vicinamibacterales bacterium]
MRALLISTYDLGRQPLGLASPAGRLRRAGVDVECVDTSRQPLEDAQIAGAALIAFYLPMHTATRLAGPLLDRVRQLNPDATVVAYGLYAPLNRQWLNDRGVRHVLGPEDEAALAALACGADGAGDEEGAPPGGRRAAGVRPDRSGLPPLAEYAALQMPDGTRRVAGSTDATRGCKHLCRHCPIVPVYHGRFRAIAIHDVIADVHAQVAQGAQHISFGDPDFLNGPTHARRLVEQLHDAFPSLTYDVTIKISHLLQHRHLLPMLRETGCLFITSAVESVDDAVLEKLRKGHTRKDFEQALTLCREAGVTLSPTFVAFTPWTTPGSYLDLLDAIRALDLVEQVAPIQLAIRLLVTAESPLLELDDVRAVVGSFDAGSLTWPWLHGDSVVDALHRDVTRIVAAGASTPRADVFAAIAERACALVGRPAPPPVKRRGVRPPMLTEPWYCCAEPVESHL